MALSVRQVLGTTPLEALDLQGRLSLGGAEAARDWLLYCSWQKVKTTGAIPQRRKVKLFRELHAQVCGAEILVEA